MSVLLMPDIGAHPTSTPITLGFLPHIPLPHPWHTCFALRSRLATSLEVLVSVLGLYIQGFIQKYLTGSVEKHWNFVLKKIGYITLKKSGKKIFCATRKIFFCASRKVIFNSRRYILLFPKFSIPFTIPLLTIYTMHFILT